MKPTTTLLHRALTMLIGLSLVSGGDLRGAGAGPEWPRFRGPDGSGIGTGAMPVHFGPESNLVWRCVAPSGHSSPVIAGHRLFLTGFEENNLLTLCFDRRDGRELWRRELPAGRIERGAQFSHPATATPVTDGTHVWVYFGAFGLACYGMEGEERWRKPLPMPVTQHGAGTSPVLAGDLLILNSDQDVGSHLLAIDRRTGATVWRTERPGFHRGFGTPLPFPPAQPDQIIVAGTLRLVSYNLNDGSERWTIRGLPNEMVASPVTADGMVFVAGWTHGSGVPRMPTWDSLVQSGDANQDGRLTRDEAPGGPARQHFLYIDADKDGFVTEAEYETISRIFADSQNVLMAIRPDGRGDVTSTHVAWRATRGLPYVPTPLVHQGRVHLVRNGGLVSCFDAGTGRILYQEERLGALGDYYASPIASQGLICAISQSGTAVIFRAADQLEVLARVPLGEPVLATPALVDGTLYLRTSTTLRAFREPAPSTPH